MQDDAQLAILALDLDIRLTERNYSEVLWSGSRLPW